ncbi:Bacteroides conjugative transposon TraN protein [Filimonas lacunae]|uniref:Bacteroides conjugative transposon TraN protein n=1 Tax=Filimonas lacunae TaxID=477680 RepID=A0A173MA65_9BACT|nr:conjugative transposon protein TraN [Filimonas lacunae]BAV04435.1 conjugative transposon protein TraN [Filimonas lacunae]SIT31437.1 Bacteroides conjugative transposon TraN protein [Filimonas lacunae]
MKKNILLAIIAMCLLTAMYAQQPGKSLQDASIEHYTIDISYNYTTVLIFPFPVIDADRGIRDLMATKQAQVSNVLKLKAGKKDFPATNLHVFTADGKVTAFDITYTDHPRQTTYDLSRMPPNTYIAPSVLQLDHVPYNDLQLSLLDSQVTTSQNFLHLKSKDQRMKIALKSIYNDGEVMFIHLEITNRSPLDYTPEFTRCYIQDYQKIKRSSVQQTTVQMIYHTTISNIPGHSTASCVIAVPRFTLSDHKKFHIEIFEKNGGRLLHLDMKNKHLLKTRKLPGYAEISNTVQ